MTKSFEGASIRATAQAVFCEVAGEAVILDVRSGKYFALNPAGTAVWQCLKTPSTLDSICDRLREEYDVAPETCRADVSALIEQLAQQGLVEIGERAAE